MDIGVKETGLAANKDENVDKVAHTSPVIGNQKNKLGKAQWHIGSYWGLFVRSRVQALVFLCVWFCSVQTGKQNFN